MDRLNHFIKEDRVVMRESDVQPLDRINDSLLLFGGEMKTGSSHGGRS
ncbi:hypothetical protein [Ralstonia sp. A12]|nr:hypothetical protein [Ralstonia sp. A12]